MRAREAAVSAVSDPEKMAESTSNRTTTASVMAISGDMSGFDQPEKK
jgi:hypothetical protein